jgi:hypothetical protein
LEIIRFYDILNEFNTYTRFFNNTFVNVDQICHYTTLDGFKGIIEENGWWLSDCTYLNDSDELKNGFSILRRLIENKEDYLNPLPKTYIIDKIDHYLCHCRAKVFAACFSTAPDHIDLWRSYLKNCVGVCICFSYSYTIDVQRRFFTQIPTFDTRRVIYNDQEKERCIIDLINHFKVLINECVKNGESFREWELENFSDILLNRLLFFFAAFKNAAFSSEKEVRQIYNQRENNNAFKTMHFRVSNRGLIPFYKLFEDKAFHVNVDFNKMKLPIKKVIVGPTTEVKDIIDSIKFYLKENGYENIQVIASSTTLR